MALPPGLPAQRCAPRNDGAGGVAGFLLALQIALAPESIGKIAPVTRRDSSEAR